MPKKSKTGSSKKSDGRMVRVTGPGNFRLDFPIPRLPRWIGTPNLRAGLSVYPYVLLDVPMQLSTSAVVGGTLASVVTIDNTLITNFATRFGSLFQEFAIVGARFEIRVTAVTTPQGMVLAYIDENSNSAPTANPAAARPHAEIPLVQSAVDSTGSVHIVEWMAHSYADLTWDAVSTSGLVAYLKLFASSATGTSASTAAQITVSGALALSFRGYI